MDPQQMELQVPRRAEVMPDRRPQPRELSHLKRRIQQRYRGVPDNDIDIRAKQLAKPAEGIIVSLLLVPVGKMST